MNFFTNRIEERYRTYCLNHFPSTRWGKQLQSLKRKYSGKRCFIIGNGPSLRADLNRLKNEYTLLSTEFTISLTRQTGDQHFYCTQDDKIATSSVDEINSKIKTPFIFAPINLKWYYGIDLHTNYFFNQLRAEAETKCPEFSEDISSWIGVGNTVAYTAMQLAAYMGFTEIYLLGIDHSFHTYQDQKKEI